MDKTLFRQRESELVEIIEAIKAVTFTNQWQTLKSKIFDGLVESLERRIKNEAMANELNQAEIYRLNGQLVWAKKYADFDKFADAYRIELSNIRKKIDE